LKQQRAFKDPETGIILESPFKDFDPDEFLNKSIKDLEKQLSISD
jgi:hypothetical protein